MAWLPDSAAPFTAPAAAPAAAPLRTEPIASLARARIPRLDVLRPDLAPPRLLARLLVDFLVASFFVRFAAPVIDFLAPAFLEPFVAFEPLGVFELDLEPERFPVFLDVMCPLVRIKTEFHEATPPHC